MTGQTFYPVPMPAPRDRDQFIAEQVAARLANARAAITAARGEMDISMRLVAHGYTSARLASGLGLCRMAEEAYDRCQEALCDLRQAALELAHAEAAARRVYIEFHITSRFLFGDGAARTALGVEGEIQTDLQEFIQAASASYEAACIPLFFNRLAQYGSLEDACVSLDELLAAHLAYLQSGSAASLAVQRRDEAMARLDEWIRRFRYAAKVALRGRPDLIRKMIA